VLDDHVQSWYEMDRHYSCKLKFGFLYEYWDDECSIQSRLQHCEVSNQDTRTSIAGRSSMAKRQDIKTSTRHNDLCLAQPNNGSFQSSCFSCSRRNSSTFPLLDPFFPSLHSIHPSQDICFPYFILCCTLFTQVVHCIVHHRA